VESGRELRPVESCEPKLHPPVRGKARRRESRDVRNDNEFKYVKWDAGASATLLNQFGVLRKLTAFGRLENILGVRYQEALGFPALGRSYLIGLSGEF